MKYSIEIPLKLPSLNEYINACRGNYYSANNMKHKYQNEISRYISILPTFEKPVKIDFEWFEINKKRDLDNICFAKKFILDALQECGKLKNDNAKFVVGFTDTFYYGKEYKVIINVNEIE